MSGWIKKRRIMRRYDLTAEIYDMRYAEEQTNKIKAGLRHVEIREKNRVLDVGCGTGILFDQFRDRSNTVVGVDISKKTLFQALRHAYEKETPNIHLVQADADYLPFKQNTFDNVFAVTILQNSPHPASTLFEIKRVGRCNTIFVITGLKSIFTKSAFMKLLKDVKMTKNALEEENLKCYVAVCRNTGQKKESILDENLEA
jgi:ubiquinone/menaquinone biosynthesis C-methylase UbiE